MEATDEKVLKELQRYAQAYFAAIVATHPNLPPGKYSAKDIAGGKVIKYFAGEVGEEFNREIEITAGAFHCRMAYHSIFEMLARWETMCRPGKSRAVFEVAGVEEVSASVLLNEKTVTGKWREKRMTLMRLTGGWLVTKTAYRQACSTYRNAVRGAELYYELNGVVFDSTSKISWFHGKTPEEMCECLGNRAEMDAARVAEVLKNYQTSESRIEQTCEYAAEVLRRAAASAAEDAKTKDSAAASPKRAAGGVSGVSADKSSTECANAVTTAENAPVVAVCHTLASDGIHSEETEMQLHRVTAGVWYAEDGTRARIIYEKNGVFWDAFFSREIEMLKDAAVVTWLTRKHARAVDALFSGEWVGMHEAKIAALIKSAAAASASDKVNDNADDKVNSNATAVETACNADDCGGVSSNCDKASDTQSDKDSDKVSDKVNGKENASANACNAAACGGVNAASDKHSDKVNDKERGKENGKVFGKQTTKSCKPHTEARKPPLAAYWLLGGIIPCPRGKEPPHGKFAASWARPVWRAGHSDLHKHARSTGPPVIAAHNPGKIIIFKP